MSLILQKKLKRAIQKKQNLPELFLESNSKQLRPKLIMDQHNKESLSDIHSRSLGKHSLI